MTLHAEARERIEAALQHTTVANYVQVKEYDIRTLLSALDEAIAALRPILRQRNRAGLPAGFDQAWFDKADQALADTPPPLGKESGR
jgi:hypothetical protein